MKLTETVEALVAERIVAIKRAAEIEAELKGFGIVLRDSEHGTTWSVVLAAEPKQAEG